MNKTPFNKVIIAAICVILTIACLTSQASPQYFLTVNEVLGQGSKFAGRNVRISGVVLGDTIEYDESTPTLSFTIANIPTDNEAIKQAGGLQLALHKAANDPDNLKIKVIYAGPKPELLRNEAQAIMTGKLGSDGIFYADELLLKCPSRYEESLPEQAQ